MIRSNILRQALVTASSRAAHRIPRIATTRSSLTATAQPRLQVYNPAPTPRSFRTTATMSHEGVHNLENKQSFDEALAKESLMVLDCFATWCGPCKVIAPKVVEFSKQYTNARFYKVDVDEVPDVAKELGIRAMPTFLLFKDGERVGEVVGANPKALEAAITQNL